MEASQSQSQFQSQPQSQVLQSAPPLIDSAAEAPRFAAAHRPKRPFQFKRHKAVCGVVVCAHSLRVAMVDRNHVFCAQSPLPAMQELPQWAELSESQIEFIAGNLREAVAQLPEPPTEIAFAVPDGQLLSKRLPGLKRLSQSELDALLLKEAAPLSLYPISELAIDHVFLKAEEPRDHSLLVEFYVIRRKLAANMRRIAAHAGLDLACIDIVAAARSRGSKWLGDKPQALVPINAASGDKEHPAWEEACGLSLLGSSGQRGWVNFLPWRAHMGRVAQRRLIAVAASGAVLLLLAGIAFDQVMTRRAQNFAMDVQALRHELQLKRQSRIQAHAGALQFEDLQNNIFEWRRLRERQSRAGQLLTWLAEHSEGHRLLAVEHRGDLFALKGEIASWNELEALRARLVSVPYFSSVELESAEFLKPPKSGFRFALSARINMAEHDS